jgi:hypothetical protein
VSRDAEHQPNGVNSWNNVTSPLPNSTAIVNVFPEPDFFHYPQLSQKDEKFEIDLEDCLEKIDKYADACKKRGNPLTQKEHWEEVVKCMESKGYEEGVDF